MSSWFTIHLNDWPTNADGSKSGRIRSMRSPVAFIGFSNSGKTTFLVSLVDLLARSGERVAVIKHTHHDPSKRKPRGDTELFLEAGAVQVVLAGNGEAVVLNQAGEAETVRFASVSELPGFVDADRILIEGFKSLDLWPRILVERIDGECMRPMPAVLAVITDSSEALDIPQFRHDDLTGVRAFLDRITSQ